MNRTSYNWKEDQRRNNKFIRTQENFKKNGAQIPF